MGVYLGDKATLAASALTTGDYVTVIDTSVADVRKVEWTDLLSVLSGSQLPVADTTAVVKGSVDATKQVRLEADGLTTGTTRVLTVPDADGTIALQSYVSSSITTHAAASDPHGDRAYALGLVDDLSGVSDAATARGNLGLGTAATRNTGTSGTAVPLLDGANTWSGNQTFSGTATVGTPTLTGHAATKGYVDTAVTGLLDFKGATDASASPNYPAASKGDCYVVSVAGKVGGASGKSVDAGDVYVASADNAGGTEASVGTSWFVIEHNLATLGTAATQNTGTSGANVPLCNGANTWSADQVVTGKVIARQSGGVAGTDEVQIYDDGTNSIITSKNAELRLGGSSTTDRLRLTGSGVVLTDCEPDGNNSRAMGNSTKSFLSMYSAAYYLATDIGMVRKAAGVFGLRGANPTDPAGFATTPRRPSQITANQNDYSPGVGCEQEWTTDASRNVTGVVAGVDGEVRYVTNTGSNDIVLPHEDTGSAAANRWYTSTGASLTLAAKKTIRMSYSGASGLSRWKVTLLP